MSPSSFVLSSSKAATDPTSELTSDTPGQLGEHPAHPREIGELPPSSAGPAGRQPSYQWLHGTLRKVLINLTGPPPASPTLQVSRPLTSQTPRTTLPHLCQEDCGEVEALEAHKLRRPES